MGKSITVGILFFSIILLPLILSILISPICLLLYLVTLFIFSTADSQKHSDEEIDGWIEEEQEEVKK